MKRHRRAVRSLESLKNAASRLALYIGASTDHLPFFDKCTDIRWLYVGVAYVEIKRRKYHWVFTERGIESREAFDCAEDLLFKVFSNITHNMASKFAASRPDKDTDFRRVMFAKQIELLGVIDCCWAARRSAEIDQILYHHHHPYRDRE